MSEYTNTQPQEMEWDDVIENDGQEFIILPEGDYVYTVVGFERGWQNSTAKIPKGCNKAILTLEIQTADGPARVMTNLLLIRSVEFKISAFFRSIGLKQHGERLVMNWNKVIGAKGMAHIKPRKYTGNDGQERTANDVDRWIDYDAARMSSIAQSPELFNNDDDIPF